MSMHSFLSRMPRFVDGAARNGALVHHAGLAPLPHSRNCKHATNQVPPSMPRNSPSLAKCNWLKGAFTANATATSPFSAQSRISGSRKLLLKKKRLTSFSETATRATGRNTLIPLPPVFPWKTDRSRATFLSCHLLVVPTIGEWLALWVKLNSENYQGTHTQKH